MPTFCWRRSISEFQGLQEIRGKRRKEGEDAMKKGEFADALKYFTDALISWTRRVREGEELAALQRLKDEASAKAGRDGAAGREALAQADQKIEEAKKLLVGKGWKVRS